MACGEENGNGNGNRNNAVGSCSRFFPDNIEELLRKLVCECVVLTYRNGNKERVKIECISGDLLVAKDEGNLKFIDMGCICGVSASRETVLDAIISPFDCD